MKIIDKNSGKNFDIPDKFKISIDKSNPFLTTQGTISLPVTFPYTDNNIEILDNPQRFDRALKLAIKIPVIIQAGIYQRESTLQITKVQRPNAYQAGSITGTFLLDEAVFYNQMKDVSMQTLFSKIIRKDFTGTKKQNIASWIDYLEKVMTGEISDDFHIFPVCTSQANAGTTTEVNGFLNHVSSGLTANSANGLPYYRLSGRNLRTMTIDSASVTIPIGYEITPFLKFSYILNTIFSSYGYALNQDYLTKYPEFQKIVELNNTCDAIMLGVINYGQLVPNKTINDYLNSVRYRYGCEFFLADNGVDVKLVFWNDTLEICDLDLSKVIMNTPEVYFVDPQTVKLTSNYSNKTETAKYTTFNSMLTAFGNLPVIYAAGNPQISTDPKVFVEQILFVQKEIRYYHIWMPEPWALDYEDLGDDLYDYYIDDSITAMEFTSPDEAVPMVRVDMGASKDVTSLWSTASRTDVFFIPYIGNTISQNSSVTSTNATDCPIMFCYHFGRRVGDSAVNLGKVFWGTTHRFDDTGTPWGNINLVYNGPNGLFETFWKKFDNVLRNSYQPVWVPVNLSIYEAFNWDASKQKLLSGQPLISTLLKYEVSDTGITVTDAEFCTTKLYLDKIIFTYKWSGFVCEKRQINLATTSYYTKVVQGVNFYYITVDFQYYVESNITVKVVTDNGTVSVTVLSGTKQGQSVNYSVPFNDAVIANISPASDTTYNYQSGTTAAYQQTGYQRPTSLIVKKYDQIGLLLTDEMSLLDQFVHNSVTFAAVTSDVIDRMNLDLYNARVLSFNANVRIKYPDLILPDSGYRVLNIDVCPIG